MGILELRLGRAGAGKSTMIAQEIKQDLLTTPIGPRIFWIVPVENSYATERLLMQRMSASLRAEVVHLHRFAQRVLPAPEAIGKTLNETGKRLLLASVYKQVLPRLHLLRRDTVTLAFLDSILDAFAELSANLVPLHQLEGMLESAATRLGTLPPGPAKVGRSLLGKLRDLSELYVGYKRALEEQEFADASELLTYAQPYVSQWSELRGSTVYVDGFADMNAQELQFLLAVAQAADKCVVTLSMDPVWVQKRHQRDLFQFGLRQDMERTDSPESVFAPQTLAFYEALQAGSLARGLPVQTVNVSADPLPRFKQTVDLALVERRIYENPVTAAQQPLFAARSIRFAAAQNPRAEVEGVAQEMSALVRAQASSYPDMVVVVPDLEEYGTYIKDHFEQYEIPYYMDVFPAFAKHPLARFLLSALQAIQDGFSVEAMARILKSDLCGLERVDADWLETYLLRFEIAGVTVWTDPNPWRFAERRRAEGSLERAQKEDARAQRLRQKISDYLVGFFHAVDQDRLTPREFSLALWNLIKATNAKKLISTWMVNDDATLSPMEASMHEQAWQLTVELLNDLALFAGETRILPRGFLFELVQSHILSQSLATIPARLGDVLVTELHRIHAVECNVLFLLGIADGALPRKTEPHGVLQDEERIQFGHLFGQQLGYTTEDWQLAERLTVYTALTRAKSLLHVSYPLSDRMGKGVTPSRVFTRLRSWFTHDVDAEVVWTTNEGQASMRAENTVWAPQRAMNVLVEALRALRDGGWVHPFAKLFLDWALTEPKRASQVQMAIRGLYHRTAAVQLTPEVSQALYRNPFTTTVYELESFAACPFQHFVHFGLRIEPADSPEVTVTAKGRLLHDVILQFVQECMQDWSQCQQMTDEDAVAAMQRMFARVTTSPVYANWLERGLRREQALEVQTVLDTAAKVLARHARYGKFEPAFLELAFGGPLPTEGEIRLPGLDLVTRHGHQVQLRGRIDRVDVVSHDDVTLFRVIDYKSSKREVDFSQIEYGLSLQLPIYALAVEKHARWLLGRDAPVTPAGMLYLPVFQTLETGWVPEDVEQAESTAVKQMRARGLLVNREEYVQSMDWRLTQGEDSELFAKVFNKDGQLAKTATVVSEHDWHAVMRRALDHAQRFGDRILQGEISVAPAQLAGKPAACSYCPYASICQIDRRLDGTKIRRLARVSKEQALANWVKEDQADDEPWLQVLGSVREEEPRS